MSHPRDPQSERCDDYVTPGLTRSPPPPPAGTQPAPPPLLQTPPGCPRAARTPHHARIRAPQGH
eukprot:3764452-Pyramimonas_sp.AAC.1